MSKVGRAAESHSFQPPSWLLDDAVEDDLAGAARKAVVEAMRRIAPTAAYPLRLDVRLFGGSVQDGVFDFSASPVLQRLDQELQAALPEELRDSARLQFVGVGQGSVIIHALPHFVAKAEEGQLDLGVVSSVEAALGQILDLHDSIERQSSEIKAPSERWENLRKLVKALDAADVNLEVDFLSPHGARRTSKISDVGREYARNLFERKPRVFTEQINGSVYGAELDGKVIIKVDKRSKVLVESVPEGALGGDAFRLGRYVRVLVQTTVEADDVGGQAVETRVFQELVSHDAKLTDEVAP
ncbi:hypothetical protein [Rhodococcus qingshengii]|uniref:hypothetical protein n=1 Tax=Rhodococcus TaxID=1827 RepID=UPI001BA65BAF|nr:hypothetical protein [Rhodococcus qingshengii]MBS3692605.1 hypothetical protein [Rhodococcus qingshengii]